MASNTIPTESDLYGLDEESRQMVLDTVGQLKNRLLTPEKISEYDSEEIFPEDTIREMLGPEIGLQLLMIPEEYGGLGGGARDRDRVGRDAREHPRELPLAGQALSRAVGADRVRAHQPSPDPDRRAR